MMALKDIRIIDLTWLLPYTTLLADLGAEVIKVEEPIQGDYSRWVPPFIGDQGSYFTLVHRNKKSLTLNLKSEKGREIFYKLAEKSDVVIESFRPGVVKRLGVDYESIKKINPRIIYCSISGYGQDGPYREFPGHDVNYIAIGGILGLTGKPEGPPIIPGSQIADLGGGCSLATIAILAALIARQKTGGGQYIDISMTDGVVSWLTIPASFHFAGVPVGRGELPVLGGFPCYNVYECEDGKYISVGCLEERFWANLCRALGKEEYIGHQWATGEKRDEIFSALNSIFRTKARDEWFKILAKADVCAAPVYSLDEVFKDPQVLYRKMMVEIEHPTAGKIKQLGIPIKFSETPGEIRAPAPLLGQHTNELLLWLGYTDKEIDEMKRSGVI